VKGRVDIIALNVHAPTEDKGAIKNSFYEELEQLFVQFSRYHMKILLKVKVKVKLFLCFKHHAMKVYWGSGCIAPLIF
jgi:hypothetical protein